MDLLDIGSLVDILVEKINRDSEAEKNSKSDTRAATQEDMDNF